MLLETEIGCQTLPLIDPSKAGLTGGWVEPRSARRPLRLSVSINKDLPQPLLSKEGRREIEQPLQKSNYRVTSRTIVTEVEQSVQMSNNR